MGSSDNRLRILVAGMLALVALALLLLGPGADSHVNSAQAGSIEHLVDSLLSHYRVDEEKITKWTVRTADGKKIRTERRVRVDPDLVSLEFNRDLGRAVSPYGAVVAGTERSRESVVVLHVVMNGVTTQTIYLETEARKQVDQ